MAKFIQVDVGDSSTAKDQVVYINLDHVTHFFSLPEEASRPEMTIFKLAGGDSIAVRHDYNSVVNSILHAAIE